MELNETLIAQVASYQPGPAVATLLQQIPMLFLVGVSGAGKDTVGPLLLQRNADQFHRIVTHTTRAPRENHGIMEQDGREYHFVSLTQAADMLAKHQYIEANVYSGNIYGTSVAELEQAKAEGRIASGDIDVNGVAHYMELAPQTVKAVFLLPPNYDVWQERLLRRYKGAVDEVDLTRRLRIARDELRHALQTDYYFFVINDDLDKCVEQVNAIAHSQVTERRDPAAVAVLQDILQHLDADQRLSTLDD